MKADIAKLLAKLAPISRFVKRYVVFIFFVVMLGIFGFLVFRINQFSQREPSDSAIEDKLSTVQHPKIDQSIRDKIKQLQDQNIQVQSLFEQARNNPFNE